MRVQFFADWRTRGLLGGLRVVERLCRKYTWQAAVERGLMRTRPGLRLIVFGVATLRRKNFLRQAITPPTKQKKYTTS